MAFVCLHNTKCRQQTSDKPLLSQLVLYQSDKSLEHNYHLIVIVLACSHTILYSQQVYDGGLQYASLVSHELFYSSIISTCQLQLLLAFTTTQRSWQTSDTSQPLVILSTASRFMMLAYYKPAQSILVKNSIYQVVKYNQ